MSSERLTPVEVNVLDVQITRIMRKSDKVIKDFSMSDENNRHSYETITDYITRLSAAKSALNRIIERTPQLKHSGGLDEMVSIVDTNIKIMFEYRSKIS